jgi:hypothetical protein
MNALEISNSDPWSLHMRANTVEGNSLVTTKAVLMRVL